MFQPLPARWLAVFPAMAALAAVAQPTAPPPAPAAAASAPVFRSAFEGYQAFSNDKPVPWKQANETVNQRGGWKAYAQEAADAAAPGSADAKADPHAGHAMPTKEKP